MIKAAKDLDQGGGKLIVPLDEKNLRPPGALVFSKMGMQTSRSGNAIYCCETYDNDPAARAIMSLRR